MTDQRKSSSREQIILPAVVFAAAVGLWAILCAIHAFPPSTVPAPQDVWSSLVSNFRSGDLIKDITASLFRVCVGFVLAAVLGIPFGLLLGQSAMARNALLPGVNFFRNLSPLAWIPFAILWFQIGDKAAIFLIFMATVFPLALATMGAVSTIPAVRFQVGRDYGYRGLSLLMRVTLPAILPEVITGLRVAAGIAWVVVVAAEMVGCQNGLGYGIYEARNGEDIETVVAYMIVIGLIGIGIDWALSRLKTLPSVRWGYER